MTDQSTQKNHFLNRQVKKAILALPGFVAIETCFMLTHDAIVSPLIAAVYRRKSGAEK